MKSSFSALHPPPPVKEKKRRGEIRVLTPTLQCNCDYTLVFLNFVILPLLFTSQHDFTPIQRDFATSQRSN
jgi:hypothetical protein